MLIFLYSYTSYKDTTSAEHTAKTCNASNITVSGLDYSASCLDSQNSICFETTRLTGSQVMFETEGN